MQHFDELNISSLTSTFIVLFLNYMSCLTRQGVGHEKDGDKVVIAGYNYWLFDYSSNSWSLAKDFSQSQDLQKETADFLKSQYGLEFK